MRGEEHPTRKDGSASPEIPPRARGRGDPKGWHPLLYGNTPACAGKSRLNQRRIAPCRKYPRVRGEERLAGEWSTRSLEIPPRARGRAARTVDAGHHAGNTPACAGKSHMRRSSLMVFRKYPRVRGEECIPRKDSENIAEIPPRARGRADMNELECIDLGNTPACAGKSLSDLQILTGVIQFLSGPAG